MTNPTDPDAADVEAAMRQDAEAFRRLYSATASRIHHLARWLTGSADVDDVVQEVYIRAWAKLPDLREPAAFGGWLRRLAVNVVLRHREAAGRRRAREARAVPDDVVEKVPRNPDLRIDLERAIATLPLEARRVFVLYDIEGWSHAEIASRLGVEPTTSRSQLHRARGLLRSHMEAMEVADDDTHRR